MRKEHVLFGRAVSHLAGAMLAMETHRGGQLSPHAAALASALSHGRATVDPGVQVGAPAPVDGTEYFRKSEDGSDVQDQVTEQETPMCGYFLMNEHCNVRMKFVRMLLWFLLKRV